MEVKLDTVTMEAMVHKAIFDSMTPEKREELLMTAIQQLTQVPRDGYSKASPLNQAFQSSARTVAEKIVTEKLQDNPEFNAQMDELFADVVRKLFAKEVRDKLVQKICDSVVSGLDARNY